MDVLDLVREFGLPLGLCLAALAYQTRLMRDILKGEMIVPRYIYDAEVRRREEVEAKLDRAMGLAERATDEIAAPAVRRAARSS